MLETDQGQVYIDFEKHPIHIDKVVPASIEKKVARRLKNLTFKNKGKMLQQATRHLLKEKARSKYYDYLQYIMGDRYIYGRHILILCQYLERVASGEIKRLLISMPPQHGKSNAVTANFPSWYLGKFPDRGVMITAYGADLAGDFSRQNRENVREYGEEIFGIQLSAEKQGVYRWELKGCQGKLTATGVGGPITGRGASLIIVDDPIKNHDDASSQVYKARLYDWYKTTLRTRLSPTGAIIVIQTRWCDDDLIGQLLIDAGNKDGEQWFTLNMPAEATGTEDETTQKLFQRKQGDPLWPEVFDKATLKATRMALGTYAWESLYQQNPVPYKDILFKKGWLQYYEPAELIYDVDRKFYRFQGSPVVKRVASLDPATGDGEDFSGIGVADVTADGKVIFRVLDRYDLSIPEQYKKVLEIHTIFNPHPFLVEEQGYQRAIRQTLLAEGHPIPFKSVQPDRRGKFTRISEMSPFFEWGKIFILHSMKHFVDEYIVFPTGKNDDVLDACEMIIAFVRTLPVFGAGGLSSGILQAELDTSGERDSSFITYTDYLFDGDDRMETDKEDSWFVFN